MQTPLTTRAKDLKKAAKRHAADLIILHREFKPINHKHIS